MKRNEVLETFSNLYPFQTLKKQGYYYCDIWPKAVCTMFDLVRPSLVGVPQYKAKTEIREGGWEQPELISLNGE